MPLPRLQVGADQSVEFALSATVTQTLARMGEAEAGRLLVMDGTAWAGLITRSGIASYVQVPAALSGAINALADR